jgi:hypothetical protein
MIDDIDVWVAMTFAGHAHHRTASKWFGSLSESDELVSCRLLSLVFFGY